MPWCALHAGYAEFKLPKIEPPVGDPRNVTLVAHDPQDHFMTQSRKDAEKRKENQEAKGAVKRCYGKLSIELDS